MSESPHPALQFAGPLKELAEGRTEADAWLAWWTEHAAEIEAACPRGWFLKLKPRQVEHGADGAAQLSQQGACEILSKLGVAFSRSDRYLKARQEQFQRFLTAQKVTQQDRAKKFQPILAALKSEFPKLTRFLSTRGGDVDRLDAPASSMEIATVEQTLGVLLPDAYKSFLRCTKGLSLDGLSLGLEEVFLHPARVGESLIATICIGEYWLEGDGDQVLLACAPSPSADAPVYYYAHGEGANTARQLTPSFREWIESLPKSPIFSK